MMCKILATDKKVATYYVTGIFALNIPCSLNTCGDWHASALDWKKCHLVKAEYPLETYGIEYHKYVPRLNAWVNTANDIRACLDLIQIGNFPVVQGMKNDFICTDEYDKEIFSKVCLFRTQRNWPQIDQFMTKEYRTEWIDYKENDADDLN